MKVEGTVYEAFRRTVHRHRDSDFRELVAFCLERLAYFKAPGFVTFCERLPLTPTEKIQRARLSELACESVDAARTVDLRGLKKRTTRA